MKREEIPDDYEKVDLCGSVALRNSRLKDFFGGSDYSFEKGKFVEREGRNYNADFFLDVFLNTSGNGEYSHGSLMHQENHMPRSYIFLDDTLNDLEIMIDEIDEIYIKSPKK